MPMRKSINQKAVVNWPFVLTTAEAQCAVTSLSHHACVSLIFYGMGIIMHIRVLNFFYKYFPDGCIIQTNVITILHFASWKEQKNLGLLYPFHNYMVWTISGPNITISIINPPIFALCSYQMKEYEAKSN